MSVSEQLGDFLKRRRRLARLTQSEVAKEFGYSSPQFISNWERGVSAPPLKSVARLCELYGVSKNDMIEILVAEYRSKLEETFEEAKARANRVKTESSLTV